MIEDPDSAVVGSVHPIVRVFDKVLPNDIYAHQIRSRRLVVHQVPERCAVPPGGSAATTSRFYLNLVHPEVRSLVREGGESTYVPRVYAPLYIGS